MRNALIALLLALAPACVSVPKSPVLVEHVTAAFDAAEFEKLARVLVEQAPLNAAVEIRVTAIMGPYLGLCWWEGDHYVIVIEVRQDRAAIIDTLVHEWAHAMVWDATDEGHHDALWGVAYARAYRIVLEARLAPEPLPAAPEAPQEPAEPEVPDDCP